MTTKNSTFIRLAVTTALASTVLAGCAGKAAPTTAQSTNKAEIALAKGKTDKAITHAEAAVLASPRDPYQRTLLGNTYLQAGRFASAAQSFEDALALGDSSPRTVVSLAIALVGMGDRPKAIYTLERHEAAIDPADFGLAIALAGQPQRGVHVLSNTLRGGNDTPKVRQNLAYAYAMSGQWREARVMVAEDVPADQVGERMSEWGALAAPEFYRQRVAHLLKVGLNDDPGQPSMLALGNNPSVEMLASENAGATDFAAADELPALSADQVERTAMSDDAFFDAMTNDDSDEPVVVARLEDTAPVRTPSLTAAPGPGRAAAASPAPYKPAVAAAPAARPTLASGDYNIQLGSYFSMADAETGWTKFQKMYPELAGAERVISKARVNGKIYYRVAAVGYARDSARSLCSSVKGKGGGCIAYAQSNPLPGALESNVMVASR